MYEINNKLERTISITSKTLVFPIYMTHESVNDPKINSIQTKVYIFTLEVLRNIITISHLNFK